MMGVVVGMLSAKGGVGKSLVAASLGAALALNQSSRVILVDLVPGAGALDILLDLKPEKTWADLVPVLEEINLEHLRLASTPHPTGLTLLAAPSARPDMTPDTLPRLLKTLSRAYSWVLVDTPVSSDPVLGDLLPLLKRKYFLVTPDAPCLRASQRYLSSVSAGPPDWRIVINQYSPAAPLNPEQIQNCLGIPAAGVLPMDGQAAWQGVCWGEPPALKQHSRLGRKIRQLAGGLVRERMKTKTASSQAADHG